MALSITAGNGNPTSQANTQTPQASVGPASKAAPSGNVQPGTATSLLTNKTGGIALSNQALTTVNLSNTTTTTGQSAQPQTAVQDEHHFNPLLLGLAIILFVLAAIFFWLTNRSAKNTTE